MKEGIKIGEIKGALKVNKSLAERGMGKEEGAFWYPNTENEWMVYDSSLEDFGTVFYIVLPESFEQKIKDERGFVLNQKIFQRYIEETLSKEKKRDLTAVEFGGPGSNIFRGFKNNFFRKTAGVCLKDIRFKEIKESDKKNNHSVIVGDIMDPAKNNKLLSEVAQTLDASKIDLIVSKVEGPLNFIKTHPAILDRIIRNWYNILNENGLMFIQFQSVQQNPIENYALVEKWSIVIKKRFPEIDIQVGKGVLRLHKKAGAPEKLPPATQLFRE